MAIRTRVSSRFDFFLNSRRHLSRTELPGVGVSIKTTSQKESTRRAFDCFPSEQKQQENLPHSRHGGRGEVASQTGGGAVSFPRKPCTRHSRHFGSAEKPGEGEHLQEAGGGVERGVSRVRVERSLFQRPSPPELPEQGLRREGLGLKTQINAEKQGGPGSRVLEGSSPARPQRAGCAPARRGGRPPPGGPRGAACVRACGPAWKMAGGVGARTRPARPPGSGRHQAAIDSCGP